MRGARNPDRVPPCVLTIAGSDSGSGAGIQADARTIHALGGYALTAVSAVTAQNRRGIFSWRRVPVKLLRAQIAAVREDFAVTAAKTGLLPGPAAIRAVAAELRRGPRVPLVVDPVAASTSGTRFLPAAGLRVLRRELLPLAALVTPNWPEAEALTGMPVRTESQAAQAACRLAAETGCAVLVKGGHAPGERCCDILATPAGELRRWSGSRIRTRHAHGTGCVLSAAIAFELARGRPLAEAIARARAFLRRALERGRRVPWGRRGGPAFS